MRQQCEGGHSRTNGSNIVAIRDIDVPFWRIVLILVKWSIAAIPAMIILTLSSPFSAR
jgi:hypothetical protein